MTDTATSTPTLPVVLVDADAPTDAALVQALGGRELLVLRKDQSFSNAVTQISRLLPEIHPDRVRAAVRVHLPDAADFDTLESTSRSAISVPVELAPGGSLAEKPRRSLFRRALVHGGLASVITLTAMSYLLGSSGTPQPFESDAFHRFAQLGHVTCSPIDSEHAKCTDVDGVVMLSTVVTSGEFTLFTFTYGTEKVVMRVFPTAEDAAAWEREGGTDEAFANVTQAGRYVFYGSDKARIESYAELVRTGAGKQPEDPEGAPPPRLAGLAFGALNLPGADQIQLVSATQENAVRALLGAPVRPTTASPALVSSDPVVSLAGSSPLEGVVAPVVDGLVDLVDDAEAPVQRVVAPAPAPRPSRVTVTVPSVATVTVTVAVAAPAKQPAPTSTTAPAASPSATTPPPVAASPAPAPSTTTPTPSTSEPTPTDPASDPVSDGAGGGLTADAAPAGDGVALDVTVGS